MYVQSSAVKVVGVLGVSSEYLPFVTTPLLVLWPPTLTLLGGLQCLLWHIRILDKRLYMVPFNSDYLSQVLHKTQLWILLYFGYSFKGPFQLLQGLGQRMSRHPTWEGGSCEHMLRTQSEVEVGHVNCSTHRRWPTSLRQQIRRIKFKSKESLKLGGCEEFK